MAIHGSVRSRGRWYGYGRPRERTEPFEFDAICMCLGDLHGFRMYLDDLDMFFAYVDVICMCVCKYLCDLHVFMNSCIHNDNNDRNKHNIYLYILIYNVI